MDPVLTNRDDTVLTVTLNRPEQFNSLDGAAKRALLDVLRAASSDAGVRAVVLTGTGRGFCVGQDLREFAAHPPESTPEQRFATVADHYAPICELLANMNKPVVAAINGAAAGAGMSLALAADFRIAAAEATFTTAFTAIGLTPDTGMTWLLPRLVGTHKALELLLLSPTLTAAQAAELGLVTAVVPRSDLSAAAADLAGRLAAGPTLAFGAIRQLLRDGAAGSLANALHAEHVAIVAAGGTSDHADALAAFLAKRKPEFRGR